MWVGSLSDKGLAPATVSKIYQLFAASIEGAVIDRYLGVAPCRAFDLPKITKHTMRFLTPDELHRLAEKMDERCRAIVLLAWYGGLRIGELSGLHVDEVDTERNQVRMERTTSWVKGHLHLNQPTTAAGRQSVGLPRFVMDSLSDHLNNHADAKIVFPSPAGGYLDPNRFRQRQFNPAIKAAGLAGVRIHDLRHTAVSLWIANGADVKRVAARAGQSSVAFTLHRYGHLYPDAKDDLMGALDAVGRAANGTSNVVSIHSTGA